MIKKSLTAAALVMAIILLLGETYACKKVMSSNTIRRKTVRNHQPQ